MAVYDVKVVRPSGVAHVAGARARLTIRLSEEAYHAGALVDTAPIVVDLPASGEATVELIPSESLSTGSGRPATYSIEESWLDPDGVLVPGGWSQWPAVWLANSGGSLAASPSIAPVPSSVWVGLDRPPAGYQWWLHATGDPSLPPGTDPGSGVLYQIVS